MRHFITCLFMIALGVEENDHQILRRVFFQTLFLRRLCTDFLETSPDDVGSSAIDNKAQLSLTNPRDACEKFARFT